MKKALAEIKVFGYIIILIGVLIVLIGISQLPGQSKIEKITVGKAVSSLEAKNVPEAEKANAVEEIKIKETSNNYVEAEETPAKIVSEGSSARVSSQSSSLSKSAANVVENEKGKIEFSSAVSSDALNYVSIGDNFVNVDSAAAPELNKTAKITLNVAYDHTPFVLMNGRICSECHVLDYSNGKVTFTVPHFTEFSTIGCNNFTDDVYVNYPGNYQICPGSYNINDANSDGILVINSSNVVIDCQNAELSGNGSGAGIIVRQFPEAEYWLNITNNLSNMAPIVENISAFIDNISFISNITIKNCKIKDFKFGMNITAVKNSRIENNIFDNSEMLLAAKETIFENNQIKNSENGIIVIGINSTVRNNLIQNNNNGIAVGGFDNIISSNNATRNSNGVVLLFSAGAEIYDNYLANNSEAGIKILDSSNNSIYNNIIESNLIGISMSGLFANSSEGNVIKNNKIIKNSEGMKFSDSNLRKFFAFVANAITGKNKHNAQGHLITGSVISSNILNNSEKDLAVEGDSFSKNSIINNMFYGAGIDNSLSEKNNIFNLEINGSLDILQNFTGNLPVVLKQSDGKIITQFYFDFSKGVLDISNIHLQKQDQNSTKGYIIVSGIENTTKTLYLDNINPNMNWVCIKDADISDISEITPNCQGTDEYMVQCNGRLTNESYSCTNNGQEFIITGLRHSGVVQYNPTIRYVSISMIGGENYNLNLTKPTKWANPQYLGAHSGPGTNCSGGYCWSRYIDKKIFNFNLTNGTDLLGTMQLDGVLLASTSTDQQTFTGLEMFWGEATIVSQNPSFGYGGNYKVISEGSNFSGALLIINETGTDINVTQFVVNTSKILSKNEIIIQKTDNIVVSEINGNVQYDINVTDFGSLKYLDGVEILRVDLPSIPDAKNKTVFIGMINSSDNMTLYGWSKAWYNTTERKYHRWLWGYPVEPANNTAECEIDSDCNDNNTATIDRCVNKYGTKVCANQVPLLYGTVVDAVTGEPRAGEQVSVYSAEEKENAFEKCLNYDPNGTEIGNCVLQPKAIPDAVTDENGHYAIVAAPGVYHIVVNGSRADTLNRYVGNEVDHIYIPKNGTIKVVVEPERIEAGFHSSAYVVSNGVPIKVFNDSHVTQTPVYINVSKTNNLEFFINVNAYDPYNFKYNLSTIDSNNHVTCYNRTFNLNGTNSSNQVIIDQLDGDTWRLWFEDLPPGHHWITENTPKEPDYDDVVFLIDYTPFDYNETNETNQTNKTYDCDNDGIPNYLDNDDSWCDYGDHKTEIINETTGKLYTSGMIIYDGAYAATYAAKDRYMAGDKVRFLIFGINNMSENATVSFVVEDHSHNPYRNVSGNIVYYGNISNENEILAIPNNGQKYDKYFDFTIPLNASSRIDFNHDRDYTDYYELNPSGPYSEMRDHFDMNNDGDYDENYSLSQTETEYYESDGRYDIHIWYNGSKSYKIGDFYVIPPPYPYLRAASNSPIYTNETAEIHFMAYDIYPDTVRLFIHNMEGDPVLDNISINFSTDAPVNNMTINTKNGVGYINFNLSGRFKVLNVSEIVPPEYFNVSTVSSGGHFNVTVIATNTKGRSTNVTLPIDVFITEDEADAIAFPVYIIYGFNYWDMRYDYNYSPFAQSAPVNILVDMIDPVTVLMGHEYLTKWDDSLTQFQIDSLNAVIYGNTGPDWVKPIMPSTAEEFNKTITDYIHLVACNYMGYCP